MEVAPTASLNGMRRSEKAQVPEKASPDFQGLKSPATSEHTFTHKHTHIMHNTTPRVFGWRMHWGVEVTESSTYTTLSLMSSKIEVTRYTSEALKPGGDSSTCHSSSSSRRSGTLG
jgi:hypothetical protein